MVITKLQELLLCMSGLREVLCGVGDAIAIKPNVIVGGCFKSSLPVKQEVPNYQECSILITGYV